MSVGQNIKNAREKNGLSQRDLAGKLNITQAAVSQFENGKNPPKIDTLLKISSALGVDINTLLEDSDSPMLRAMKRTDSPLYDDYKKYLLSHSVELDNIDIELINNFHKLNDSGRKRLLEYLSELLKILEYTEDAP